MPRGLRACLRISKFSASAFQGNAIIGGVELNQDRAGLDVLVVIYIDADYGAAHARADGNNVAVNLCVVGGLADRVVAPHAVCSRYDGEQDKQQHPLGPRMRAKIRPRLFFA